MLPDEIHTYVCKFLNLNDLNSLGRAHRDIRIDLNECPKEFFCDALSRRGLPYALLRMLPSTKQFLQKALFLPSIDVPVGYTEYLDQFTYSHYQQGRVIYGKDDYQRGFISFFDENNTIKTFFQRYSDRPHDWTVLTRGRENATNDPYEGGGWINLTAGLLNLRLCAVIGQICETLERRSYSRNIN